MKTLKLLFGVVLLALVLTSCQTDIIVQDDYVNTAPRHYL